MDRGVSKVMPEILIPPKGRSPPGLAPPLLVVAPDTHKEHGEGLAHDGVEEVQGGGPGHQEEVAEEEVFPAAVVQQGVVLAPEERLEGILQGGRRSQCWQG